MTKQPHPPSIQPDRFLRLPEVMDRTSLSRSGIYAAIQRGGFPAPVSLGSKAVAWLESEIMTWQAARLAERDQLKERVPC